MKNKKALMCALLVWADVLIERGVELMTLEQLSEWDGVRTWQETIGRSIENVFNDDNK
jgi:hypothetical protein